MRSRLFLLPILLLAGHLVAGCSGSSEPKDTYDPKPIPAPTEFKAGVASERVLVPVGMCTTGYNGLGGEKSKTPFANMFPGTTGEHDALMLRAVALSRGPGHRMVIVKFDAVGVYQMLRTAVVEELKKRTGEDYSDGLILAANHTHSGPGRVLFSKGTFEIISDTFFPAFYDRFVKAFADVAEAAIKDLRPAKLGTGWAETHDAHSDRRCENDALPLMQENPAMPMVAIQRDGKVDALVMSYAYHGTILDRKDLMLSGDAGGIIERKVAERFDHPVQVLFLNAWGADMAPGNPPVPKDGADQSSKYDRMEALGEVVADVAMPAVEKIQFTDKPKLRAETHQFVMSREALGYGEDEFPYKWGAVFCGGSAAGNCKDDHPIGKDRHIDRHCMPFSSKEPVPGQSVATAGWIGDLYFSTGPGEWSTSLADKMLGQIRKQTGSDKVMFIGYANDYTGYSLIESDWWQAGYEASGAIWGPKQGDYLAARGVEAFAHVFDREHTPLAFEDPGPYPAFSGYEHTTYNAEAGVDVGTIVTDVPEEAKPTDIITFTVLGTDPWLGTPIASLEQDKGDGFKPVLRHNTTVIDSAGYEGWVNLTTDPTYDDKMPAPQRKFMWKFSFPIRHKVPGSWTDYTGKFRFVVHVPTDLVGGVKDVPTGVFTVTTSSS